MFDSASFAVGALFMFLVLWWGRHRWALRMYMKFLKQLPWNRHRKTVFKRIPPWYLLGGKNRGKEYERACCAVEKHLSVIGAEFDE